MSKNPTILQISTVCEYLHSFYLFSYKAGLVDLEKNRISPRHKNIYFVFFNTVAGMYGGQKNIQILLSIECSQPGLLILQGQFLISIILPYLIIGNTLAQLSGRWGTGNYLYLVLYALFLIFGAYFETRTQLPCQRCTAYRTIYTRVSQTVLRWTKVFRGKLVGVPQINRKNLVVAVFHSLY